MSEDGVRQRQEIPTHLEIEDRILFGLTLRQGVILLLGTTVGYFLFAQSGQAVARMHIPLALRVGLGLTPVFITLAMALIQPAGRPLEDWLFAIARYLTLPKQCVWRPRLVPVNRATPEAANTGTSDKSLPQFQAIKVASGGTSIEQSYPQDNREGGHETKRQLAALPGRLG